jgi:peroxiredoxin Q/BCP
MLNEKDVAPDFEVLNDEGQPTKLSDFKGRRVVLYFYPKAMTSGCTTQACALRDDYTQYKNLDAVILGASPDSVERQAQFKEKENLPFTLLADEDHAIAEAYGVWVEKSMYGRKYWGVERSTFLIDADGRIEKIFRKVKPKTHSEQVLAALSA